MAIPHGQSKAAWKARQRLLNKAVKRLNIRGLKPLIVDGKPGPATRKRIKQLKWFLGYAKKSKRTTSYDREFHNRLVAPYSRKFQKAKYIRLGKKRIKKHNEAWKRNHSSAGKAHGVGYFDGVPVANWLIPYLRWARRNGWIGHVNSGWRDPNYSEHLCYVICGAPRCPGRCAGRSSNHAGSDKPRGAVDVSDYYRFGQLMRRCPLRPHIFNALGARDPVHFSATGN
jgi:hypothetical protein